MSPTPEQEQRERDSAEQAGTPPVKRIEIARQEDEGSPPKPPHFQPATQEKAPATAPETKQETRRSP